MALVRSNSHITDIVTTYDFMPVGITVDVDTVTKEIRPLSEQWRANNFFPFGAATDGTNTLIFHNSVNIGGGEIRLSFNNMQLTRKVPGPTKYYDTTNVIFPYPTVVTNQNAEYYIAHAYNELNRTWYLRVVRTTDNIVILDVEGIGRSIPLWMGKPEGDYIGQGIASISQSLDCWGGYIDFCDLTKCIFTHPSTGVIYNLPSGILSVDREYHKACVGTTDVGTALQYTAMQLRLNAPEKIDFLFIRAVNPLPLELSAQYPELFADLEQTGRINFVTRGLSYQVDNYTYWDNGWDTSSQPFKLPSEFKIDAIYSNGEIHLTGTPLIPNSPLSYWGWKDISTQTWWSSNCYYTWGRAFIKWNGTISLNGQTRTVIDELGLGEFSRYNDQTTIPITSTGNLIIGLAALGAIGLILYKH